MCGCAYWEFVFMFFGYSAEKLSFPAVESFNQSITLGNQTCLEFDSILLEHRIRSYYKCMTSVYECISVKCVSLLYLYVLYHISELHQELFGLCGAIRQNIERLRELSLER